METYPSFAMLTVTSHEALMPNTDHPVSGDENLNSGLRYAPTNGLSSVATGTGPFPVDTARVAKLKAYIAKLERSSTYGRSADA